jgi:putative ABC transport system substrate-binding protein
LLLVALPVWAQAPARIAWIWPGSGSGEAVLLAAFKDGMRENGMVEGQHYTLDERYADGRYDRFPALTEELLTLKPAILMVNTIASVRAAQQATRTVPIIFVATNDPVGSGLIASYARPGGNTTGLSTQNEDAVIKQLELLHEVIPWMKRIAVLVNPSNPSGPKLFEYLRSSAGRLGIEAMGFEATSPQGLDAAFDAIAQHRPDALIVMSDAMLFSERARITAFALRNRIPASGTSRDIIAGGGLISYGALQLDLFRRSATYVKKILAGATPADLPVEQPTKFAMVINLKTAKALRSHDPAIIAIARRRSDPVMRALLRHVDRICKGAKPGDLPIWQPGTLHLVINLKTAKGLGITIPPPLLLRADEVIQ